MNALKFGLTCPLDGGPLDLLTQADPIPRQLSAICRCGTCGSEHHLLVQLHTTRDTRFKPGVMPGSRKRRAAA